jgi:hypothetical protein
MKNSRRQEGRPLPGSYLTHQVNQAHLIFDERAALLYHRRHCLPRSWKDKHPADSDYRRRQRALDDADAPMIVAL